MSAAIVLVALVPVAIAGLLAGPIAAQALYIGIVLMSSVVRSLEWREQLLAAVFAGLVSALGAWGARISGRCCPRSFWCVRARGGSQFAVLVRSPCCPRLWSSKRCSRQPSRLL